MAATTISSKLQVVIPKEVRDKLRLTPRQRLSVIEKGGVITLVPEVPLKSVKGVLKGMTTGDVRGKQDREGKSCWIPVGGSSSSPTAPGPTGMPPI